MKGIIIAGGLGTRLRPLTLSRPKPLVPIVNAPLLEYQLMYLRSAGITTVCFATNYMADVIQEQLGDGSAYGMELIYATESEPLDTGGAIRNAYDALEPDDCVVFNGDTIHGFDIGAIVNRHRARGGDVTLTLIEAQRPHAYGVVPISEDDRVLAFLEPTEEQKRRLASDEGGSDFINAGLYVLSRAVLDRFPVGRSNVERDVFPRLIGEGARVLGDVQSEFWIDIGRPSQYLDAVRAVIEGVIPSARELPKTDGSAIHPTAEIHKTAKIGGASSIGPSVKIGEGAVVLGSAVLDGAQIESGATVENSVVCENALIREFAVVSNSALGPGSVVTAYSRVGGMSS